MRAVAVIPARYGSSRFPGKPLVPLLEKPLIAWVVERAGACPAFAEVIVATDHPGIAEAARAAGARAVMTSPAMATLARPLADTAEWLRPDVVKVVCDGRGNALYFSRAPIPHFRDEAEASAGPRLPDRPPVRACKHLGVYAFRREALFAFTALPEGRLEQAERLEQLRALEAGWRIRVVAARSDSVGVDRPEDVARVEEMLRGGR